jgi:hypothetical protein
VIPAADDHRRALGFRTVRQLLELASEGVRVLDPHSAMISAGAVLGPGTLVYPSVVVQRDDDSAVELGPDCVLYPGAFLRAESGGRIVAGSACEFGPGAVQVKASGPDAVIELGHGVRLLNGCELTGRSMLGDGSQIIGPVWARSVTLDAGLGGYGRSEPDERGGVLKGVGMADGVRVGRGEVISQRPSFDPGRIERQSAYHPAARGGRAGQDRWAAAAEAQRESAS